jgi:hypothetical protein
MAFVYEPTEEMKSVLNGGEDPFRLRVMYNVPGPGWGTLPEEWVVSVRLVTERTGLFGTVRRVELVLDNSGGQAEYPDVVDGVVVSDPESGEWSSSRRMAFVCVFDGIEDQLCWLIGPVADSGVRRELCLYGEELLHVTVWDWGTSLQHKSAAYSGRVKILLAEPALASTGSMIAELQSQRLSNPIDCDSPVSHSVGPVVLRRDRSLWEEMNNLADSFWAGIYYGADEHLNIVNSPYDGNPGDPVWSSGWVDQTADEIDASVVMSDVSVVSTTEGAGWMRSPNIGVDWQRYSVDSSRRELWRLSENYSFNLNECQAYVAWYGMGRSKISREDYDHLCVFRSWDERPIVGAVDVEDTTTIAASATTDPPGTAVTVETGDDLDGEKSDDWLQVRVVGDTSVDEVWLTDLKIKGKPVYDDGVVSLSRASADGGDLGILQRFRSQYLTETVVHSDTDVTVTHARNFAYRYRLMKESESQPILLELKGKPVHWNCSRRVGLAGHGACLPDRIVVTFGRGETWTTVEARHYEYGALLGSFDRELHFAEQGFEGLPRRTLLKYNGDVYLYNPSNGQWKLI